MSFVIAAPEMVASAASDLASIGSMIGEANAAAVAPTTGVMAAAEDEVSAAIAALFSSHAQDFQALSAQAAAFHAQFVQVLNTGAGSYVSAEAANASAFTSAFTANPAQTVGQDLTTLINTPFLAATGRPAIGNTCRRAPTFLSRLPKKVFTRHSDLSLTLNRSRTIN